VTNLSDLMGRIREVLPDDIDDETVALVERVATSAALLAARASVGEDVDREMQHVKAQAMNLSAEYLEKTIDKVRDWLLEAVGKVVSGLL